MMKQCDRCDNWAQWIARRPKYEENPNSPRCGAIIGWELIFTLCCTHKEQEEELESNADLVFNFVGAIPLCVL